MAQIENSTCLCCGQQMEAKPQQLIRRVVTLVTCKNASCIMHDQTLTTEENTPERVDFYVRGLVKAG